MSKCTMTRLPDELNTGESNSWFPEKRTHDGWYQYVILLIWSVWYALQPVENSEYIEEHPIELDSRQATELVRTNPQDMVK